MAAPNADGASVIAKQVGFSIDTAHGYVAEVEIRADLPDGVSTIFTGISSAMSALGRIGSRNITVTNQWQKVRLSVQQPRSAFDKNGRLGLELQQMGVDSAGIYSQLVSAYSGQARIESR